MKKFFPLILLTLLFTGCRSGKQAALNDLRGLTTEIEQNATSFNFDEWLKEQKKGKLNSNIKWNFTKFLLDREGNVVARYAPTETPEKIDAKVAALL